jgi:alkylation response protein AidB-like acyl-CoA dehydrogenase
MNLTEPQAGSDLAMVRTRAEPQPDGTYKLFGTKIFITYGEHDMAENIVHLVLARVPGRPKASRASLFIVPKFWSTPTAAGRAQRRALRQHRAQAGHQGQPDRRAAATAATTAARSVGYLVGQENRGLEYMFIMMNAARFGWACRASRGRARLPEGRGLRARPGAEPPVDGWLAGGRRRSSTTPTCAAC